MYFCDCEHEEKKGLNKKSAPSREGGGRMQSEKKCTTVVVSAVQTSWAKIQ